MFLFGLISLFVTFANSTDHQPSTPEDWYLFFEDMDLKYKAYESILYEKRTELTVLQSARDFALAALRKVVGFHIGTAGVRDILLANPSNNQLHSNIQTMIENLKDMNIFNSTIFWHDIKSIVNQEGSAKKTPTLCHIVVQLGTMTLAAHKDLEANIKERREIGDAIKQNIHFIESVYTERVSSLEHTATLESEKRDRLEKMKTKLKSIRWLLEHILKNLKSVPATIVREKRIRDNILTHIKALLNRASEPSLNDVERIIDQGVRFGGEQKFTFKSVALAALETVDQLLQHAAGKEQEGIEKRNEIDKLLLEFKGSLEQMNLYK